ncbi:MAG TPA: EAL domain-containing protein [Noviherbaspirillum sp.]|nr:EAL domain-containing protein [Noviherbaspirillum sp.]
MSTSVTFNSAHGVMLTSEFFMARRPVLDREHNLVAHELLFCNVAGADACLTMIDDERPAPASVIADVYQHGMGRVIGDLPGILYIDGAALMSDIFQFLPPQKVMLEVSGIPQVTATIVQRLVELTRAGFRFVLAVDTDSKIDELLPLIEGVRIDVSGRDQAELGRLCRRYGDQQKKLLAERVDTVEQYKICHELGFDFFQGYYFTKASFLAGKRLWPSQRAIAELLELVASDAPTSVIEHRIKGDISLGLNLLRLANTPEISVRRIESLRQVLMLLGRNQLQSWLRILQKDTPGVSGSGVVALIVQATTRGKLMELIANKLMPGNRAIADTGFTVGIMSLMDTAFSMPMADLLRQIPVAEEVAEALIGRRGYFGQLLSLVEHTEWPQKNDTVLVRAIRDLNLSYKDLYLLQLTAFEWSDQAAHHVG